MKQAVNCVPDSLVKMLRKEKGVDEGEGGGGKQRIEKIVLPLCLSLSLSLRHSENRFSRQKASLRVYAIVRATQRR
jgi:hypothetical protein